MPTRDEECGAVWAADPDRTDPEDYPPGSVWVRQMTWAPCIDCDRQVHAPVTQVLLRGLTCPDCGRQLIAPVEDGQEYLARVLREEDELAEQL